MFFSRGPNHIQHPYTVVDIYKDYGTKIEGGSSYDVGYKLYRRITELYFRKVINLILEQSDWFRLLHNLGTFQIVKKHSYASFQGKRETSIDWENTLKYGKRIVHLNEHSDGYKYLFFWDKRTSNVVNVGIYRFVPTRAIKRKLAENIKKYKKDYFEYDKQEHKYKKYTSKNLIRS